MRRRAAMRPRRLPQHGRARFGDPAWDERSPERAPWRPTGTGSSGDFERSPTEWESRRCGSDRTNPVSGRTAAANSSRTQNDIVRRSRTGQTVIASASGNDGPASGRFHRTGRADRRTACKFLTSGRQLYRAVGLRCQSISELPQQSQNIVPGADRAGDVFFGIVAGSDLFRGCS